VDCNEDRVDETMACLRHAGLWNQHIKQKHKSTLNGIRRVLQRPGDHQAWQQPRNQVNQPHDDEQPETGTPQHYFSPSRFYCVETLCAPCGIVVAWTKFDKSESPTKILNWLEEVYPNPALRPAYICIDKACQVLRTAAMMGVWETWKTTSRFIVDTYHYTNHQDTDWLCQKFCNPAPEDNSVPNLVGERVGRDGKIYKVSKTILRLHLLIR